MADWGEADAGLLRDVNGLAEDVPGWADRVVGHVGEWGLLAVLGVLCVVAWRTVRRRSAEERTAVTGAAALLWAPLAAGIALAVNVPLRELVARPRPFVDHRGLEVLVPGKGDYSFVSDHTTLAAALAVCLFMVNRRLGLAGFALAAVEGLLRVYLGVHYPTDVVGGFALGAAVALLGAPLASYLLSPLVRRIAGTRRGGPLVWAPVRTEAEQLPLPSRAERGLAA